ncbi:MAG: hypothetical protein ACR2QB_05050 [Gammaproteobacteria bacterium]
MQTNLPTSSPTPPAWLLVLTEVMAVGVTVSLALLFALQPRTETDGTATDFTPPELPACDPEGGGYLRGQLYGDIEADIDWEQQQLKCDGMLRPDNAGLRLLFEPQSRDTGPLFVLGLAGSLEEALDREVVTNLTIVDQRSGRFFNTGDSERCWTRTTRIDVNQFAGGRDYRLVGRFYCAGALAEVNGPGTLTPGEFEFAGRLTVTDE